MNKKDEKLLRSWKPCRDGLEWGLKQKSLYEVYRKCNRSDWLLWLIEKTSPLKKEQSVRIAIVCAERVLKHAKGPEAKRAIEAAKAWLENPCEETRAAAGAAAEAAWAAGAAVAAWAAAEATWAAGAAGAAWAAARAARAAWAAEAAAERKWQSNAIRKIVPNPFKKPKEGEG